MEIGSHYYAVLALCRLLGMKKKIASKVAYSSEMVDDALIERVMFKEARAGLKLQKMGSYLGLDSCSTCPHLMTVWSYNHAKMMKTLVPFHFIPSCKGNEFNRRIRTHPDSPMLKDFLEDDYVMKSPFHLGIILHVLGDAFAHQGFSGIVSRGNRIRKFRVNLDTISGTGDRFLAKLISHHPELHSRTLARVLPMYSHSRVGTVPDLPSVEWSYEYDIAYKNLLPRYVTSGLISNPQRYIKAFEKFQSLILRFLALHPKFKEKNDIDFELSNFFLQLTKNVSREETEHSWRKFMLKHALFDFNDHDLYYDKHYWLKHAFENYKARLNSKKVFYKAIPKVDFLESDWYHYYLAQREYKKQYALLAEKYEIY